MIANPPSFSLVPGTGSKKYNPSSTHQQIEQKSEQETQLEITKPSKLKTLIGTRIDPVAEQHFRDAEEHEHIFYSLMSSTDVGAYYKQIMTALADAVMNYRLAESNYPQAKQKYVDLLKTTYGKIYLTEWVPNHNRQLCHPRATLAKAVAEDFDNAGDRTHAIEYYRIAKLAGDVDSRAKLKELAAPTALAQATTEQITPKDNAEPSHGESEATRQSIPNVPEPIYAQ